MMLLIVPLPFCVEHLQRHERRARRDAGVFFADRVVAVAAR